MSSISNTSQPNSPTLYSSSGDTVNIIVKKTKRMSINPQPPPDIIIKDHKYCAKKGCKNETTNTICDDCKEKSAITRLEYKNHCRCCDYQIADWYKYCYRCNNNTCFYCKS